MKKDYIHEKSTERGQWNNSSGIQMNLMEKVKRNKSEIILGKIM